MRGDEALRDFACCGKRMFEIFHHNNKFTVSNNFFIFKFLIHHNTRAWWFFPSICSEGRCHKFWVFHPFSPFFSCWCDLVFQTPLLLERVSGVGGNHVEKIWHGKIYVYFIKSVQTHTLTLTREWEEGCHVNIFDELDGRKTLWRQVLAGSWEANGNSKKTTTKKLAMCHAILLINLRHCYARALGFRRQHINNYQQASRVGLFDDDDDYSEGFALLRVARRRLPPNKLPQGVGSSSNSGTEKLRWFQLVCSRPLWVGRSWTLNIAWE